jgi:hypothetical protein
LNGSCKASYFGIDKNRRNVIRKERIYKRRQAMVEHPFGIIKRQWGFYFVLCVPSAYPVTPFE